MRRHRHVAVRRSAATTDADGTAARCPKVDNRTDLDRRLRNPTRGYPPSLRNDWRLRSLDSIEHAAGARSAFSWLFEAGWLEWWPKALSAFPLPQTAPRGDVNMNDCCQTPRITSGLQSAEFAHRGRGIFMGMPLFVILRSASPCTHGCDQIEKIAISKIGISAKPSLCGRIIERIRFGTSSHGDPAA